MVWILWKTIKIRKFGKLLQFLNNFYHDVLKQRLNSLEKSNNEEKLQQRTLPKTKNGFYIYLHTFYIFILYIHIFYINTSKQIYQLSMPLPQKCWKLIFSKRQFLKMHLYIHVSRW